MHMFQECLNNVIVFMCVLPDVGLVFKVTLYLYIYSLNSRKRRSPCRCAWECMMHEMQAAAAVRNICNRLTYKEEVGRGRRLRAKG